MAYILLGANETFVIEGGNNTVSGSVVGREVVTIRSGTTVFTPDFNAGGDTFRFIGNSADYLLQRSGSSILVSGPNGVSAVIPAPRPTLDAADQPVIAFDNGSARLSSSITGAGAVFRLGATEIGTTPVAVGSLADSGAITLTVTAADTVEGGDIVYIFALSRPSNETITVLIGRESSTATPDLDFGEIAARITFDPGQTRQSLAIATFDDRIVEPTETITLAVTPPAGVSLDPASRLTARIFDNDGIAAAVSEFWIVGAPSGPGDPLLAIA